MSEYRIVNGVTMKPGTTIYVSDRDDPNWDREGTIVSAESGVYIVQFGKTRDSIREYSIDQIMPSNNT